MLELIAISGPLAGARFPLGAAPVEIGRAPASTIRVSEPEAAWKHCVVRVENGGAQLRLVDLHSGSGTYVNGIRVHEHVLEAGDQIAVGESVFVLREPVTENVATEASPRVTLLRACTLLFVFRGVAASTSPVQSELLETHALSLISELLPCTSCALLLSTDQRALRELAEERAEEHSGLPAIVDRLLREGSVTNTG